MFDNISEINKARIFILSLFLLITLPVFVLIKVKNKIRTRADVQTDASTAFETESGVISGLAGISQDASASNGRYVVFGQAVNTPVPSSTIAPTSPTNPTPTGSSNPTPTSPVQPTPTVPSGSGTIRVPQDYATIQAAINAAQPGKTIVVSPGTYSGALTINKAITLQASSYDSANPKNNTTIIDGANGSTGVIDITAGISPEPKIIGFYIRNASSGYIIKSPAVIEYNYFTGAGDLGEYEKGSGGTARGNFYENSGDDCIDLDNQINSLLIENNKMLNCGDDGVEMRIQDDTIAQLIDITLRNNRMEGCKEDGIQLIDYSKDTNRRYTIEGNLILNSRKAGIGLMGNQNTTENYEGASIREEVRVINNTISGNNHGITGGDNLLAINNIIINNSAIGMKNTDNKSKAAYNLFYGNGTNFTASNVDAATTKTANPNLGSDFRPAAGSPAIDAGTANISWDSLLRGSVTVSIPSGGYTGSAPDMGAFR